MVAAPAATASKPSTLSQGEHRASPFTVPNPEDRSAIQVAIGEILNRLASNELDPRRAGLLLYGLQIASANLPAASALAAAPVEETATDPDLGTLALPAEILPDDPAIGRPSSLFDHLLRELNRSHPAPPEAVRYPERDATTHRSHHP